MLIIAIILLIIAIFLISIKLIFDFYYNQCTNKIIYKDKEQDILALQFDDNNNLPSKIYEDLFNNDNIWISGYSISSGKTNKIIPLHL